MKSSFGIICCALLAVSCALAATTKKEPNTSTVTPLTTKLPDPTTKPTPPHCTTGQRRPVKHSCKNFEECDESFQWVPKNCSTFCKVFHPQASKCVWNWQYPCLKPTTTTTTVPSTVTDPSPSTSTDKPECSATGTKKNYKKGDCKNYLECDGEKWVKKSCSFGYDFDVNKKDCVWSWWATC